MNARVRYLGYIDFSFGKKELIIAIKKLNHFPESGKDSRFCSDPEDCFGFTDCEYDVLDSDGKLANHYKSKISAHHEEIIFSQAALLVSENKQTYCHNGAYNEDL